ncbi:MAG: hypothetical protein ACFE9R_01185 [Candidatus Hermodarchaeota archaeon]
MSFDIFRVDWILIDSVISIILIILLIGINILKWFYRWRIPLSNKDLAKSVSKIPFFKSVNPSLIVKKWSLIYPKYNTYSKKLPTIFILRMHRKFMLLNALAEGLSTYGFNIVNLWIQNPKKVVSNDKNKQSVYTEIINYLNQNNFNLNCSYSILAFQKIPIGNENDLFDSNTKNFIILNPIMNDKDLVKMSQNALLYSLLSEKFILFFRNPNLKRILLLKKEISSRNFKVRVIKGAKRSFKYYETILLGEVINFFDNNSYNYSNTPLDEGK